ncbi:MAG: hypothetical protein FJ102_15430 [Deltaproteobacteria bacterium]|nr:hypothetical protein [Deltaproteobacteria bacterium]
MPPRATHRLRVVIVPGHEGGVSAREALDGLDPVELCGEVEQVRVHDGDREFFLANEQGGFHVCCPVTGEAAARPFARAVQAWREGGPRELSCRCGDRHDLAAMDIRPGAAFAARWIELCEPAELEPRRGTLLDRRWPGWTSIVVRG